MSIPAQECTMAAAANRKRSVSMRFRSDDLIILDRGAERLGLSRTELMRRAALHEAQTCGPERDVIRLSPDACDAFMQAISAPAAAPSPKAGYL